MTFRFFEPIQPQVTDHHHSKESKASTEELKAHSDFIQQEMKGYEVKVFNKEKKAEEKAVIRLIAHDDPIYAGRYVFTKKSYKPIIGNDFIPPEEISAEHLNYEQVLGEKRWIMKVRKQVSKEALFIEDLQGSNGGNVVYIGMNFIRIAIQLSHKKGLKGALELSSNGNSPGFYWLAGLSYARGKDAYMPKIDKDIMKKVTKKLISIKDDTLLEKDADCMQARILLAKQIVKKDDFESDARYAARLAEYVSNHITISELRLQWSKLLRARHLYEMVPMHDLIMDELAFTRLNLPRFKTLNKERYDRPDTTRFYGTWTLEPMSVEQWEKIVKDRRECLNKHMEKIGRNEIMSEKQFVSDEAAASVSDSLQQEESSVRLRN